MVWYLIAGIFLVGLWGVIGASNIITKVIGLSIASNGVIMFFIAFGSLSGDTAPINVGAGDTPVDPIPQALMLTAIVVGICIVAVALVLAYRLYRRTGTLDIDEIERTVWRDEDEHAGDQTDRRGGSA